MSQSPPRILAVVQSGGPSNAGVTRRSFAGALLASLLFATRRGAAEDVAVPVSLQAELMVKVAAYDKNFVARAGSRAKVLVVRKGGNADSTRVAKQMLNALSAVDTIAGLPHDDVEMLWTGATALAAVIKKQRAAMVYFAAGFGDDVEAIDKALEGSDVLTVSSMPSYVPKGIVLGFDLVGGKAKLLCHLGQAKKQKVAFKAEALKLMKVYE